MRASFDLTKVSTCNCRNSNNFWTFLKEFYIVLFWNFILVIKKNQFFEKYISNMLSEKMLKCWVENLGLWRINVGTTGSCWDLSHVKFVLILKDNMIRNDQKNMGVKFYRNLKALKSRVGRFSMELPKNLFKSSLSILLNIYHPRNSDENIKTIKKIFVFISDLHLIRILVM